MTTTARTMTIISALKQSVEMGAGPGLSVNRHPNHFMINVNGEIDLLKAAELVQARLAEFEKQQAAQGKVDAAKAPAKLVEG